MKAFCFTLLLLLLSIGAFAEGDGPMKSQAYWQERFDTAKRELEVAKSDLQDVEAKMLKNRTLGGPGMQERMATYAKEEADLKTRISQLDRDVHGGIAREARDADAPEAWYENLK